MQHFLNTVTGTPVCLVCVQYTVCCVLMDVAIFLSRGRGSSVYARDLGMMELAAAAGFDADAGV